MCSSDLVPEPAAASSDVGQQLQEKGQQLQASIDSLDERFGLPGIRVIKEPAELSDFLGGGAQGDETHLDPTAEPGGDAVNGGVPPRFGGRRRGGRWVGNGDHHNSLSIKSKSCLKEVLMVLWWLDRTSSSFYNSDHERSIERS